MKTQKINEFLLLFLHMTWIIIILGMLSFLHPRILICFERPRTQNHFSKPVYGSFWMVCESLGFDLGDLISQRSSQTKHNSFGFKMYFPLLLGYSRVLHNSLISYFFYLLGNCLCVATGEHINVFMGDIFRSCFQ